MFKKKIYTSWYQGETPKTERKQRERQIIHKGLVWCSVVTTTETTRQHNKIFKKITENNYPSGVIQESEIKKFSDKQSPPLRPAPTDSPRGISKGCYFRMATNEPRGLRCKKEYKRAHFNLRLLLEVRAILADRKASPEPSEWKRKWEVSADVAGTHRSQTRFPPQEYG